MPLGDETYVTPTVVADHGNGVSKIGDDIADTMKKAGDLDIANETLATTGAFRAFRDKWTSDTARAQDSISQTGTGTVKSDYNHTTNDHGNGRTIASTEFV